MDAFHRRLGERSRSPNNYRIMKFGIRYILIGLITISLGLAWFALSFTDAEFTKAITGGVWKGPLLAIAGARALFYGIKAVKVQA